MSTDHDVSAQAAGESSATRTNRDVRTTIREVSVTSQDAGVTCRGASVMMSDRGSGQMTLNAANIREVGQGQIPGGGSREMSAGDRQVLKGQPRVAHTGQGHVMIAWQSDRNPVAHLKKANEKSQGHEIGPGLGIGQSPLADPVIGDVNVSPETRSTEAHPENVATEAGHVTEAGGRPIVSEGARIVDVGQEVGHGQRIVAAAAAAAVRRRMSA